MPDLRCRDDGAIGLAAVTGQQSTHEVKDEDEEALPISFSLLEPLTKSQTALLRSGRGLAQVVEEVENEDNLVLIGIVASTRPDPASNARVERSTWPHEMGNR